MLNAHLEFEKETDNVRPSGVIRHVNKMTLQGMRSKL
jgi:hypothetical protein